MSRRSRESYFLQVATVVATQSTCLRRQVGAVLVDDHDHIMATGYNGSPSGLDNCVDLGKCPRDQCQSGENLIKCNAVHAEQNALLQCHDVNKIKCLYVTTSPCLFCVRMLLNTSCKIIIYITEYDHLESSTLWRGVGRSWIQMSNVGIL
jgi:dCMP deaminase